MFYGTLAHGRDKMGVLGPVLNSHPMALKHLVPALMSFYVGEWSEGVVAAGQAAD